MNKIKVERNLDEKRLQNDDIFNWPIWTKEISEFPWTYSSDETCYFLEGDVVVTPDGGDPYKCCATLLCVTCDLPARAAVMNFVQ